MNIAHEYFILCFLLLQTYCMLIHDCLYNHDTCILISTQQQKLSKFKSMAIGSGYQWFTVHCPFSLFGERPLILGSPVILISA